MSLCYLNGEVLPLAEARVSVYDRGFLFGDGIYEVVPAYGGRLFYWRAHMARLRRSLAAVGIGFDVAELTAAAARLLAEGGGGEQGVYIQITRGAAAKRQHAPPSGLTPTVFIVCGESAPMPERILSEGAACLSGDDFRWRRCDIKSVSLLGAVLIAGDAARQGADDVVLFRDGVLTEGSSCNYIVVNQGALLTPLVDERILHGVTYRVVLETARRAGYAAAARDIRRAEVAAADELWLTSSRREMMPVTSLDGAPVGDGAPGRHFKRVRAALLAHIDDIRARGEAAEYAEVTEAFLAAEAAGGAGV